MRPGTPFIGTSGWSYAHWSKGVFYPRGLKAGDWLRHLSGHFSTVEINASFYRLPEAETIAHWVDITTGGFRFAIKLWRRITHEKRLIACGQELRDFLAVADVLGDKRGPLLIQLPPSLHRDDERLDTFLADLQTAGQDRWRVAVEFRHTSWLARPVNAILDRHSAALVLADKELCLTTDPGDAPFVYIRRHGPGGSHQGCYSEQHLARDAERIAKWLQSGRDVYIYFNNDVGAHAVRNARRLAELLGVAPPVGTQGAS